MVLVSRNGRAPAPELVAAVGPADIVLVDAAVGLPAGWLGRLVLAARERTDIGTVTPAFGRARAIDPDARRVIIAPAVSHCLYVTRRALTVLGARVDLRRVAHSAAAHGFVSVLAADVTVTGQPVEPVRPLGHVDLPATARAPRAARDARAALTVAIDAELIDESLTGTYEVGLAISRALAAHPEVSALYWVVPQPRVEPLRGLLTGKGITAITVTTLDALAAAGTVVDIAFRPYQDFLARTWPALSEFASRNIVWTLDLIANVMPGYARSRADFDRLNRTSAFAWENADAIAALSPHVAGMLDAYRGTSDPRIFGLPAGAPQGATTDPGGDYDDEALRAIGGRGFVLMLGNSYVHKARVPFLRIARRVIEGGWDGAVVLAGPTPQFGSSTDAEAELTRGGPFVVTGRVSDDDRARLLSRATVAVCPSVTEGWGMIPAEALAFGSVPLTSRGGGLRDTCPVDALAFDLVDEAADAALLHALLTDPERREAQAAAWRRAAGATSWERSAAILVERMHAALASPARFRVRVAERDVAHDALPSRGRRALDLVLHEGNPVRSALGRLYRRVRGTV